MSYEQLINILRKINNAETDFSVLVSRFEFCTNNCGMEVGPSEALEDEDGDLVVIRQTERNSVLFIGEIPYSPIDIYVDPSKR